MDSSRYYHDEPERHQSSSSKSPRDDAVGDDTGRPADKPRYMTVGNGSLSDSANRLADMLDEDSGYGGSVYGGDRFSERWMDPMLDIPSTASPRSMSLHHSQMSDRRVYASHVHQLHYNQNRTTLARAITQTVDALKRLQTVNTTWPAHYPTVHVPQLNRSSAHRNDPRPGLPHTQSTTNNLRELHRSAGKRPMTKRADTMGGDDSAAEASAIASQRPPPEPRLVTPQLAQEFSVLKIDLKMGNVSQSELVHSLEKSSIASLLDNQISKTIRHLYSLRERIEDTSSKVLVTGDLNAGKSTFCNALLRRKILPEDQQPCTSIFCEVLDVRDNGGVEEVHAVPIGARYSRNDERTYKPFPLKELEHIVLDSDRWSQCKVYIKDIRGVDESLLNNGVVDIALIDAPGLNADSLKTTALFARQEEIDVVVFVVSAANHFTLSARDFIFTAAREKAYIFMVVNGFDNIRDKQRCQETILKQIATLSPATFKESSELVHFVSSNAIPIPENLVGQASSSSSSGGGDNGPTDDPGDDNNDDDDADAVGKHGEPGSPSDKGKGKEKEKLRDFAELESSLRRFVLEKRAKSKLAPAKTYLTNLLGDLNNLAIVNQDVAKAEFERVSSALEELEPAHEQSKKATVEVGDETDRLIEEIASTTYSETRTKVNGTISAVAGHDHGLDYPGLWNAYRFAEDLKAALLDHVAAAVSGCEDDARVRTVGGIDRIKGLGISHTGADYVELVFRPDRMFKRRKDALAREVDFDVEAWDFFDVGSLWERQEKVAGTSLAVTVAGVLGTRVIGGVGWIDGALGAAKVVGSQNLRRLIIPGLMLGVMLGLSYAIASIPQTLPQRLSRKLAVQLEAIDYTHANALRISSEVRRALKYPADSLRVDLQRNVEKLQTKRNETGKIKAESEIARKFFTNLVRDSADIRQGVERVDLDGPAPGPTV